jgi:hypothetical protein
LVEGLSAAGDSNAMDVGGEAPIPADIVGLNQVSASAWRG